ncbi:MAG: 2-amino-4-hydroxy-6-hydroxymethyldihydropteridine diphosphokinase [Actinomycetota bacterium]
MTPGVVRGYLGLGSNLGDRLVTLQAAADGLAAQPGIEIEASSRVYETAPVGGPEQPDYLNTVVRIRTTLTPRELLSVCQRVEADLGRVRDVRWGPRTIDVDILTFDERTIDETDLQIPHPRMHERAFVLLPLLELDSDPPLPDGQRIDRLRLPVDMLTARVVQPPLSVSG